MPRAEAKRAAFEGPRRARQWSRASLQVPNLDNAATALFLTQRFIRKAPLRGLWLVGRAVMDKAASLTGLPPVYARAIGRSGEWAAYVNDISADHVDDIRGPAWKNRIALRDFVNPRVFRPVRHAATVPGPMMIVTAERDDITPVAPVLKAAALAGLRAASTRARLLPRARGMPCSFAQAARAFSSASLGRANSAITSGSPVNVGCRRSQIDRS